MDLYQISVPGKTFLLGEYVVLQGGPAIVLTTSPRFTLIVDKQSRNKTKTTGIHNDSPAGKLIQRCETLFHPYHLNFVDEYHGIGGFGASGAQFLMISALRQHLNGKSLQDVELLKEYETLAWNGEGMPPSGIDLIAQLHGGICYFHKVKKQLKTFLWPFQDIDYCLIHTGNKLATHEHLKQLAHLDMSDFEKIVAQGKLGLEQENSQLFIDAILNYATVLAEKNLIAMHTQEILKQLSTCADILAKKGCGALGADVIAVFFKRNNHQVIDWLKKRNFNVITYGHKVEKGLQISKM